MKEKHGFKRVEDAMRYTQNSLEKTREKLLGGSLTLTYCTLFTRNRIENPKMSSPLQFLVTVKEHRTGRNGV